MYHAVLLMDADSGEILYQQNPDLQWPPASMAKMMLLAVTEDRIKAGRLSYTTPVRISERAATTGGSRLGLHEGAVYPLGELMKAALIKSANDAAVAIAEKVGGSVEGCVRLMNQKAHALGMDHTHYETPDGLPPRPLHDVDYTTAHDLALLARSLILHTHLLRWSSLEEAPFDGGPIMLHNTNHLIGRLVGCDGLKTGFTIHAGFNLTATAERGDMRLISVVLGAPSNPERFAQSAKLLDWGFGNYTKVHLISRGEPLPVHIAVDGIGSVQPVAENDVSVLLRKNQTPNVHLEYGIPKSVRGPLPAGATVGDVFVMENGEILAHVDAVTPGPAPTGRSTVLADPVVSSGAAPRSTGLADPVVSPGSAPLHNLQGQPALAASSAAAQSHLETR